MVLFLEVDDGTNINCLHGSANCNNSTMGDWVTGTPYPIIDNAEILKGQFRLVIMGEKFIICPDKIARSEFAYGADRPYTADEFYKVIKKGCQSISTTPEAGLWRTDSLQHLYGCDSVAPILTLANYGNTPLTQCKLNYFVNGALVKSHNWTGNIPVLGTQKFSGVKIGAPTGAGNFSCYATISNPNNTNDTRKDNDTGYFGMVIFGKDNGQVLNEPFNTFPPNRWTFTNSGDRDDKWIGHTATYGGSPGSACFHLPSLESSAYNQGRYDRLCSPSVTIDPGKEATLEFDYALSACTLDGSMSFSVIWVPCDGSASKKLVENWNQDLETAPLNNTTEFIPKASEWKHISLPVKDLGKGAFRFEIRCNAAQMNNFYLDNVNVKYATGIDQSNNYASIVVYPNPASKQVTLNISALSNESANIQLINAIGQVVHAQNQLLVQGSNEVLLNVQQLPDGVYTIHVNGAGINSSKKLVINSVSK